MDEKKKYLEGTLKILNESRKEKRKYFVNINQKKFVVYPNVFSPKYFKDTEFFSKEIPVKKGDDFLEIGCGTGIVSIFAVLKGAKSCVSIDINDSAVENTKENVKLHKLSNKIKTLNGDVYSPLKDEKFDVIFWNTPFAYSESRNSDMLEMAVIDPYYISTRKFVNESKKYLKKNGKLIIGFSSTLGNLDQLKLILQDAGYSFKILKSVDSEEVHTVKFEIIEAKLKKYR